MSDNLSITHIILDHQRRLQAIDADLGRRREVEEQRFREQLVKVLPQSRIYPLAVGEAVLLELDNGD